MGVLPVVNIHSAPIPLSANLPLDYKISDAVKAKIWGGQFVKFSQLLDPENTGQFTLGVSSTAHGQSLCLQQKKTNLIQNIESWSLKSSRPLKSSLLYISQSILMSRLLC